MEWNHGGFMSDMKVPIWHKQNLTIEEANKYSGIGINKLRELCNDPTCPFVLHVGTRHKLIKRTEFDKYIKAAVII